MLLKSLTFAFLLHICALQCLLAQKQQAALLKFVSNRALEHASVGVYVKDFAGNELASYNKKVALTPASTLKIVTTATSLELLGANYVYRTTLAKDLNNPNRLIVRGYGDPTLGTAQLGNDPLAFLNRWTDTISKVFPNRDLDIHIADDYFGYDGMSYKWLREDMGSFFGPCSYGITVFDNAYKLTINTHRPDTCPSLISIEPEVNIAFNNQLKVEMSNQWEWSIIGQPLVNERTLVGSVPAHRDAYEMRGDMPNPGLFLGQTLADRLSGYDFKIRNLSTSHHRYHNEMFAQQKSKINEDIFYTHTSFSVGDIVRDVNVRSNNLYAEALIRTMGRQMNSDIYSSALNEGIQATTNFWDEKGLKPDALFMYDGCGLSPSNAVSAEFLCNLLVYMQNKSQHAEVFFNSFPRAGKEGTVKSQLRGTRLDGKVYMKSGSISKVRCFTGYYINGPKKYAFAIMVNKYNGKQRDVDKAINELLLGLF